MPQRRGRRSPQRAPALPQRRSSGDAGVRIVPHRTALVPVADLELALMNPNQGDCGAISESIQTNGFYGFIVAQEGTGRVIAGEHRLRAAQALGASVVPVVYLDVDDARARRIMLADNRTARLASDDPTTLATLLQEVATEPEALEGTGYDGDDLDALLAELGVPLGPDDLDGAGLRRTISFPNAVAAHAWDSFIETLGQRDPTSRTPGLCLAAFLGSIACEEALEAYRP